MKFQTITSLFIFILLLLIKANAQVQIENLSFEKALKKAKKEDKILMVVVDSKNCERCNEVAKQGLADTKTFVINKLAVSIQLTSDNPDWEMVGKKYYKQAGAQFGTLFFNGKGTLIHRFDKSTTNGGEYLAEINTALQSVNLLAEVEKLETAVKSGSYNDLDKLEELLKKRKLMQSPTEDLLENFIKTTPVDSFKSVRYFQTLARFAPILNTKADSVLRQSTNFNKYWYSLNEPERIAINQEISNKTWRKAIAEKDYVLESKLADFSGAVHENANPQYKSRTRIYHLQSFYKAVKDTAEYLKFASLYVDMTLMPLTLDSINRLNKKNIAIQNTTKRNDSIGQKVTKEVFTTTTTVFTPFYYSGQLNSFAWNFYKMSNDSSDWKRALQWAKKGMDIFPTPELMDTYAQLLYVTGNREEAILQEQNVIEEKKKAHREKDIPITERILAKMKSGATKVAE